MQKATRNQLSNVNNKYQGNAKKVLCLCSAGLLRSPTLANVLHQELNYNTRAVGTSKEYALVPITEALIAWADEIVFVDEDCQTYISKVDWEIINEWNPKVVTLNVPDNYNWNDPELRSILIEQYANTEAR